MSVQACTPSIVASASAAALFSVRIDAIGFLDQARIGAIELDRRADDAGAERLGEDQRVARPRAGVREHARGIDGAGHRIAELDLLVLDGMAPEQRRPALAQLVEAACENRGDGVGLESCLGKAGDGQRGERAPAHRIHVAERVRGGNLAVDVRVVDDGRKEIHRLHQRRSPLPNVHTGIVMSPEIDQDSRISLRRKMAQDLSELAWSEFARSTRAADHLGQPLLPNRVMS